jgi:hypothetical protein
VKKQKMDANTRNFEAEIEAQHVEEDPEPARIHADAEVATITAL